MLCTLHFGLLRRLLLMFCTIYHIYWNNDSLQILAPFRDIYSSPLIANNFDVRFNQFVTEII